MKLAILAQSYLFDETASINGTLVQLYNLSQGFKAKNVDVHYVCLTRDLSKPKYEILNGIHFYWIKARPDVLGWKKEMAEYKRVLCEIKPEAIYVRGRNVMLYVAGNYSYKYKVPFVWGTNGDDSAEFWKNSKRLKDTKKSLLKKIVLFPLKWYEDLFINKGMKWAQHVVSQNTHQKEQTLMLLNKTSRIINSYYFIEENQEKITKEQVLWLARWSKEKQPELFVDMVSRLDQPNVTFVMAGDPKNETTYKELANTASKLNIKIPGKISYKEVNSYFSKALIFVNTSYREGVSNTFIEAMLNGVPVLSLNSNPNNWLTDYNIGYCANGDLEKLTMQLNSLLKDRTTLETMSTNAKTFAKQQFSNDSIIESYIKLFQQNA